MRTTLRLLREALLAPAALSATVIFGTAGGLLLIVQAWLLSQIISRVFLNGADLSQVQPLIIWLLAVIGGRAILAAAVEVSSTAAAVQVKNRLRRELFRRVFQAGPLFTLAQRSGELTAQAVQGIDALDPFFSQYLPQLVLAGTIPVAILLFVAPLDWLTGLVFLFTAPLIPVFMVLIGRMAENLTKKQFLSLSRMSAFFLDTLQGLTTLKYFGLSLKRASRVDEVGQRYRSTTLAVLRVTFLSALVLELVATISTALVAVQIGLRLLYSQLDFQRALFILILAPEFYQPLRMLGQRFHAGMTAAAAAEKIYQAMDDAGSQIAEKAENKAFPIFDTTPEIVFNHVSCAYPGREVEALRDVSLKLPAGKVTAVVGGSGAGKTTLAWMLLGFLTPQGGQIQVNSQEVALADDGWRRQVAWVPQNPTLFTGTLRENICLGVPDADSRDLEHAVSLAGLNEWVDELPLKLDTPTGEQGSLVSGGQAQRIALARAFLRTAQVVILDEPTSSLDLVLEDQIEKAIFELCKGKTALIIAHRLGAALKADQVIVLEQGQVVETGTPAELIQRNGLFSRLVRAGGKEESR